MSNEIQIYKQFQNPLEAIARLGTMFAKSGMAGCEREEQGQVLAWACLAEGMSPFEVMRTYHLLPGGRLTKKGMSIYAEFLAIGGKLKWIQTGEEKPAKEDDRAAIAEITFGGQTVRFSYSIADAKLEGLFDKKGSRYKTAPGEMLRSKVQTKGIPLLAPGLVAGGDDETAQLPERELTLAPAIETAVTVESVKTAEPVKEKAAMSAKVAEIISDDEKELAKAGLAPVQKVEPEKVETKTEPVKLEKFVATDFGGKLTNDTLMELQKRIGADNEVKALEFISGKGWIKDGDLRTLPLKRAQMILDNTQSFLDTCGAVKK